MKLLIYPNSMPPLGLWLKETQESQEIAKTKNTSKPFSWSSAAPGLWPVGSSFCAWQRQRPKATEDAKIYPRPVLQWQCRVFVWDLAILNHFHEFLTGWPFNGLFTLHVVSKRLLVIIGIIIWGKDAASWKISMHVQPPTSSTLFCPRLTSGVWLLGR